MFVKDSLEGQKKVQENLHEMPLENLALSKELAKSLEKSYFIAQDSFESVLKHLEYFHPTGPIS